MSEAEAERHVTTVEDAAESIRGYFAALGEFIHRFAELEGVLAIALRDKAGVSHDTACALFSGVRAREALAFLKRLHEAEDEDWHPLLARVQERFGSVMEARNLIVHHGTTMNLNDTFVSSKGRNLPGKGKSFPVSAKILSDLTGDVQTMIACVTLWHIRQFSPSLLKTAESVWGEASRAPWRYK